MSALDPVAEATKAQNRAADPVYSVFVTANAGSGKTKVLVDRIARLLLEGSKPSAFLCITYTKAAAAEMQRRLFERLGGWCVADDETLAADLRKLEAPNADLARARALFAQALETPGGLKIQTIHAFCERLLARFPLEAGVPPGFDIADEPRAAALLGQARASAALAHDAPRGAFRRFAAKLHGEGLEGLLDRLALRRSQFRRFERRRGAMFAEQLLRDRHGAVQTAEEFAREFILRVDLKSLRQAAARLAEGTKQDQDTSARLVRAVECMASGDAGAMAACFAFALTDGKLRANFVTKSTQAAHPWLEGEVRAFAEACANARERLNAIERAEDAVAARVSVKLDRMPAQDAPCAGCDDLIEAQAPCRNRKPRLASALDGGSIIS
jgi:ATP-dependent helicase/nuclease subunit A